MLQSIYTNTANPKSIIGLLVVTVGVAYCKEHSTEIVDGTKRIINSGIATVEQAMHNGKQKLHQVEIGRDGTWKSASRKATWR